MRPIPSGPATPGEELTVDSLVSAFRKLGLTPGNKSSFVQRVPLVSVEVSWYFLLWLANFRVDFGIGDAVCIVDNCAIGEFIAAGTDLQHGLA